MKAHVKVRAGRMVIEVEGSNSKELFDRLVEVQEVFDLENCGLCDSADIHFVKRTNGDYKFYEAHCRNCGGRLQFGQKKDMVSLYAKRRDDDGVALPANGWSKFVPTGGEGDRR